MSLTDDQQLEMYKSILEIRKDMEYTRKQQEEHYATTKKHEERICKIEKKQAVITTKLGAFILAGILICTAIGNATIYLFQRWILK